MTNTASGDIASNAIFDNNLGLESTAPVDARENWWGCRNGPLLGAACNPVSGPAIVSPFLTTRPGCTRPKR